MPRRAAANFAAGFISLISGREFRYRTPIIFCHAVAPALRLLADAILMSVISRRYPALIFYARFAAAGFISDARRPPTRD